MHFIWIVNHRHGLLMLVSNDCHLRLFFLIEIFVWGLNFGYQHTFSTHAYEFFSFVMTYSSFWKHVIVTLFKYYYLLYYYEIECLNVFIFRHAWKLMQMGMGQKSLLMPLTLVRVDGLVDHCMSYSGECTAIGVSIAIPRAYYFFAVYCFLIWLSQFSH